MPLKPHLRALWIKAGYPPAMGSAAVVPPPPKPLLRVYHLAPDIHATSNIAFGRMKVATISELNDPFELLGLSMMDKRVSKHWNDFREGYNKTHGLLCFSANWTSPALWSHYGDRHRGVCLGFDVPRALLKRVRYADTRIKIKTGPGDTQVFIDSAQTELLMLSKYRHWEYEQEYRRFIELTDTNSEGQLYFRRFDSALALREVILGPQNTLTIDVVRNLVDVLYPSVVTFRSRLASKSFSVVPQEKSVL